MDEIVHIPISVEEAKDMWDAGGQEFLVGTSGQPGIRRMKRMGPLENPENQFELIIAAVARDVGVPVRSLQYSVRLSTLEENSSSVAQTYQSHQNETGKSEGGLFRGFGWLVFVVLGLALIVVLYFLNLS